VTNPSLCIRAELDIIDQLRNSACVESSGEFTLDPAQAVAKMRQFSCEDPYHYVLWLVAAAVKGGGQQFRVLSGVRRTSVEFDGEPLTQDEMVGIFSDGRAHQHGRARHLFMAACLALNLRPKELLVESVGARVTIADGTARLEQVESPAPGPAVRFSLVFGGVYRLFSRLLNSKSAVTEQALLKDRVCWPQLALTVNHRSWSATWGDGWSVCAIRRLRCGISTMPIPSAGNYVLCEDRPSPGPFSAILGLKQFDVKGGSTILFIRDGVSYTLEREHPVAYVALIECPELKFDLSQTSIVKDEFYLETIRALDRQAEELARTFLARFEEAPAWRKAHVNFALTSLIDFGNQIGDPEMVQRARSLLAIHCRDGTWVSGISASDFTQQLRSHIVPDEPENPLLNKFRKPKPTRVEQWVGLVMGYLDPRSGLRMGVGPSTKDTVEWLTLDGVRPDGIRILLHGEDRSLTVTLTYPVSLDGPGDIGLECPIPWDCAVKSQGDCLLVTFSSLQACWREVDQLEVLLASLLEAIKRVQIQETLPCPGCTAAMQKVVLDVVLDRCVTCRGAWFDYAELEWLLAGPGLPEFESLGPGQCPHCQVPLVERYRGRGLVQECPHCQGAWVGLLLKGG